MTKKLFVVVCFFGCSAALYAAAGTNDVATQASMILKAAERYHYAPRPVDDSLSASIFRSFLRMLDPYGIYCSEELVRSLGNYRYSLDEQILRKQTMFLDTATVLVTRQLNVVDSLLHVLTKKELNFSERDTFWIGGEGDFCSQRRLPERWRQWLKYLVLWTYQSRADSAEPAKVPTQEQARKLLGDVVERETCRIRQKLTSPGGIKALVGLLYLKAVAGAFDPHTIYMSPSEKNQFQAELSTAAGSFGLRVNLNLLGEIEVVQAIPGGPAWASGKINEGDVLLAIEIPDGKSLDLRCSAPDAVYNLLSSANCTKAEFTIRKKNGKTVHIVLKKKVLDVEENTVQSFLIGDSADIAYIYLPSFYADFTYFHYLSEGCANDLGKELIKLRSDAIRGLVLDLRGNSGGSMEEAFRTAGAFVNEGALCIIDNRGKGPSTVKDHARGVVYDGPMVVLVNSSSASAAELLAAVLQDNNRAVIIGSTTFGKATMQSIIPVNAAEFDSLSQYKGEPPGFLTITNGCVYRVSGDSYQKAGVTPDIELPDLFENMEKKEASFDGCLVLPKISKKTYSYPEYPLPIKELKALSKTRMKTNPVFKYTREHAQVIPQAGKRYPIPLNFASYTEYADRYERLSDTLSTLASALMVKRPSYAGLKTEIKRDASGETMREISNDASIYEAMQIIHDLIQLQAQGKCRKK